MTQNFDLAAFRNSVLSEHNTLRATHHSPSLTLSDSLNASAQAHAESILQTGVFRHSSFDERNGAGENLYYAMLANLSDLPTYGDDVVRSWYREVSNYDYDHGSYSSATGHFTQVVWKSTSELGCGVAQGRKKHYSNEFNVIYVVCHYQSAGNYMGQFMENVLKP